METVRRLAKPIVGLFGLALCLLSGTAQASLVQTLTLSDPFNGDQLIGMGQIEFDAPSGNDTANVVSFSFQTVTIFPGFPTLTKADIVAVDWMITNWELTEFTLLASVQMGDVFYGLGLDLVTDTLLDNSVCGFADSTPASFLCRAEGIGSTTLPNRDLTAAGVHDVPEPASFALFAIALSGLGFMVRRWAV